MFQSSPALSDGRYGGSGDHGRMDESVSILARPFGRALRDVAGGVSLEACFNPRPPFRTGATVWAWRSGSSARVSILARPFGRALLGLRYLGKVVCAVSILARPFGRALHDAAWPCTCIDWVSILARPFGRALRLLTIRRLFNQCFNPRPPFRTGATCAARILFRSCACFNPRPPFRTGATVRNQPPRRA